MKPSVLRIGERLVDAGLINEKQLQQALAEQQKSGGKIVQTMFRMGVLRREDFINFLAREGFPALDLSAYDIDPKVASLVPLDYAKEKEIFCLDLMGSSLTLGMGCVLDQCTIDEVAQMTGFKIKPIVCNHKDILAAIERYETLVKHPKEPQDVFTPGYDIEGLLTPLKLEGLALLVRNIESLPMLPDTVRHLEQAILSSNSTAQDIAAIIERDPAVAAKLLSVANSSTYSLNRRIASVREAVSIIGFSNIRIIVSALATMETLNSLVKHDYRSYYKTSQQVGQLCYLTAQELRASNPDQYFAAGLLYDIGKAVLMVLAPELWKNVDQRLSGELRINAEQETIGLSHTEAGYLLALHWGLPECIQESTRFHHQPELATSGRKIVNVVSLVDKLIELEERAMNELAPELRMLNADRSLIQSIYRRSWELATD